MDISKLKLADKADKGAVLTILDPYTNVPTDLKITLSGTDSTIYRNWIKKNVNKALGQKNKKTLSYEETQHKDFELLAALTLGWEGLESGGKLIEFSTEKAYEIYADPNMKWLKEQVDEFIADRANFS